MKIEKILFNKKNNLGNPVLVAYKLLYELKERLKELSNLKNLEIHFPLTHPKSVEANKDYDEYCSANIYSIPKLKWRIKNKLKKLFLFKNHI